MQVYDLCHFISNSHSKTYIILTKIQRIEWNNRFVLMIVNSFLCVVCVHLGSWILGFLKSFFAHLAVVSQQFMLFLYRLSRCTLSSGPTSFPIGGTTILLFSGAHDFPLLV